MSLEEAIRENTAAVTKLIATFTNLSIGDAPAKRGRKAAEPEVPVQAAPAVAAAPPAPTSPVSLPAQAPPAAQPAASVAVGAAPIDYRAVADVVTAVITADPTKRDGVVAIFAKYGSTEGLKAVKPQDYAAVKVELEQLAVAQAPAPAVNPAASLV